MADDGIFAMIADERRALADLVDGLSAAQWDAPSLCAGWRVREVVAHTTMGFSVSMVRLALMMLVKRGDFNKVADTWARRDTRSNAELVAALRANAEHRFTPPGAGPEIPLTDVVVHAQDIARPLGLAHPVPPAHAVVALDALVGPKGIGFFGKGFVDGLAFTATDTGWQHGTGAEVAGPAALVVTLARRPSAVDALSGDGVPLLRARFGG
jgi:uncharacterized protein (TIGR03083 family)